MGKITGFMEHERIEEGYKPVAERLKNYGEFVIGLTDAQAKTQASRCMDCGTPFCNSGCPVNNIIPDFNDLVYQGDWKNAIEVLHSTNNFPEFTGRICPAPCEAACVVNFNDDAANQPIHQINFNDKAAHQANHQISSSENAVQEDAAAHSGAHARENIIVPITSPRRTTTSGEVCRLSIGPYILSHSPAAQR